MKNNYLKLIILSFLLSGCGVKTVNLGFKNTNNNIKYPILIHLMNNPQQTVFSKIVKFDEKNIANGEGELFKIVEGTHFLDVKWVGIINGGNSYFITGVLPPNSFLSATKVYHIKANFENGYTYMIDQGQLHNKDKYVPSKLCLLKRPTLADESKAYRNGTISNDMQLVACYDYEGNNQKDYRISNTPW